MTGPGHGGIAAHVLRPARIIRSVCQMVLGAGLAMALVLKVYMLVLTDYQCSADAASLGNMIRCHSTLEIMSYALALAAGFELAGLLFERSMERAIRPLLLGLSAAFLLLISGLDADSASWRMAATIAVLSLSLFGGLAFLDWVRRSRETERGGSADGGPDETESGSG